MVVEVVAADMAATVAAAVVDSVAVSVYLSTPNTPKLHVLITFMIGRSQGANGPNAMPMGNRRW